MQTEVVLCFGGNKGNREELIQQALGSIKDKFHLVQCSKVYESAPWGGVAVGKFLNQVAIISTSMSAESVLDILQQIEIQLGRTRVETWGDRTMDIDIIFFGDSIIQSDRLTIPHPFLGERKFVLVPLVELIPDRKHPVSGKSMIELLQECEDQSEVVPVF